MMQEFVQNTKNTVREELKDIHTAMPGRIISVNTGQGTCTVQPVLKKKASNGSLIEYPKISGVPMWFPQGSGQGCSVVYPVTAGDGCLIIVSEQSLDYWMYGRVTDSDLAFDLTNAICIPGLFQQVPSVFSECCKDDAVIVIADETKLKVKPDGVEITGNLTVDGTIKTKEMEVEESITAKDAILDGISMVDHTHKSAEPGDDTGKPE